MTDDLAVARFHTEQFKYSLSSKSVMLFFPGNSHIEHGILGEEC